MRGLRARERQLGKVILFGSIMALPAVFALSIGLTSPDSPGMQSDLPVPPVILWFSALLVVCAVLIFWGIRRLKTSKRELQELQESLMLHETIPPTPQD